MVEIKQLVLENWEAVASLVVFLACLAGYKIREKLVSFDRDKKIEKALVAAHKILEKVAPKTKTNIDDYVDDVIVIALEILEHKDELVGISENDEKKLKKIAVEVAKKVLNSDG
jgi:hypothetical protein